METDFKSMKRKDLQALCKKHGLPANSTNLQMVSSLESLLLSKEKNNSKGCLRGSGGSTGEEAGEPRGAPKKVSFSLDEEKLDFAGFEGNLDGKKRRSSRRSLVATVRVEEKTGFESVVSEIDVVPVRTRRSRSLAEAVVWSPVVEKKKASKSIEGVRQNDKLSENEGNVEIPTARSLRNRAVVVKEDEEMKPRRSPKRTRQKEQGKDNSKDEDNARKVEKETCIEPPVTRSLRSRAVAVVGDEGLVAEFELRKTRKRKTTADRDEVEAAEKKDLHGQTEGVVSQKVPPREDAPQRRSRRNNSKSENSLPENKKQGTDEGDEGVAVVLEKSTKQGGKHTRKQEDCAAFKPVGSTLTGVTPSGDAVVLEKSRKQGGKHTRKQEDCAAFKPDGSTLTGVTPSDAQKVKLPELREARKRSTRHSSHNVLRDEISLSACDIFADEQKVVEKNKPGKRTKKQQLIREVTENTGPESEATIDEAHIEKNSELKEPPRRFALSSVRNVPEDKISLSECENLGNGNNPSKKKRQGKQAKKAQTVGDATANPAPENEVTSSVAEVHGEQISELAEPPRRSTVEKNGRGKQLRKQQRAREAAGVIESVYVQEESQMVVQPEARRSRRIVRDRDISMAVDGKSRDDNVTVGENKLRQLPRERGLKRQGVEVSLELKEGNGNRKRKHGRYWSTEDQCYLTKEGPNLTSCSVEDGVPLDSNTFAGSATEIFAADLPVVVGNGNLGIVDSEDLVKRNVCEGSGSGKSMEVSQQEHLDVSPASQFSERYSGQVIEVSVPDVVEGPYLDYSSVVTDARIEGTTEAASEGVLYVANVGKEDGAESMSQPMHAVSAGSPMVAHSSSANVKVNKSEDPNEGHKTTCIVGLPSSTSHNIEPSLSDITETTPKSDQRDLTLPAYIHDAQEGISQINSCLMIQTSHHLENSIGLLAMATSVESDVAKESIGHEVEITVPPRNFLSEENIGCETGGDNNNEVKSQSKMSRSSLPNLASEVCSDDQVLCNRIGLSSEKISNDSLLVTGSSSNCNAEGFDFFTAPVEDVKPSSPNFLESTRENGDAVLEVAECCNGEDIVDDTVTEDFLNLQSESDHKLRSCQEALSSMFSVQFATGDQDVACNIEKNLAGGYSSQSPDSIVLEQRESLTSAHILAGTVEGGLQTSKCNNENEIANAKGIQFPEPENLPSDLHLNGHEGDSLNKISAKDIVNGGADSLVSGPFSTSNHSNLINMAVEGKAGDLFALDANTVTEDSPNLQSNSEEGGECQMVLSNMLSAQLPTMEYDVIQGLKENFIEGIDSESAYLLAGSATVGVVAGRGRSGGERMIGDLSQSFVPQNLSSNICSNGQEQDCRKEVSFQDAVEGSLDGMASRFSHDQKYPLMDMTAKSGGFMLHYVGLERDSDFGGGDSDTAENIVASNVKVNTVNEGKVLEKENIVEMDEYKEEYVKTFLSKGICDGGGIHISSEIMNSSLKIPNYRGSAPRKESSLPFEKSPSTETFEIDGTTTELPAVSEGDLKSVDPSVDMSSSKSKPDACEVRERLNKTLSVGQDSLSGYSPLFESFLVVSDSPLCKAGSGQHEENWAFDPVDKENSVFSDRRPFSRSIFRESSGVYDSEVIDSGCMLHYDGVERESEFGDYSDNTENIIASNGVVNTAYYGRVPEEKESTIDVGESDKEDVKSFVSKRICDGREIHTAAVISNSSLKVSEYQGSSPRQESMPFENSTSTYKLEIVKTVDIFPEDANTHIEYPTNRESDSIGEIVTHEVVQDTKSRGECAIEDYVIGGTSGMDEELRVMPDSSEHLTPENLVPGLCLDDQEKDNRNEILSMEIVEEKGNSGPTSLCQFFKDSKDFPCPPAVTNSPKELAKDQENGFLVLGEIFSATTNMITEMGEDTERNLLSSKEIAAPLLEVPSDRMMADDNNGFSLIQNGETEGFLSNLMKDYVHVVRTIVEVSVQSFDPQKKFGEFKALEKLEEAFTDVRSSQSSLKVSEYQGRTPRQESMSLENSASPEKLEIVETVNVLQEVANTFIKYTANIESDSIGDIGAGEVVQGAKLMGEWATKGHATGDTKIPAEGSDSQSREEFILHETKENSLSSHWIVGTAEFVAETSNGMDAIVSVWPKASESLAPVNLVSGPCLRGTERDHRNEISTEDIVKGNWDSLVSDFYRLPNFTTISEEHDMSDTNTSTGQFFEDSTDSPPMPAVTNIPKENQENGFLVLDEKFSACTIVMPEMSEDTEKNSLNPNGITSPEVPSDRMMSADNNMSSHIQTTGLLDGKTEEFLSNFLNDYVPVVRTIVEASVQSFCPKRKFEEFKALEKLEEAYTDVGHSQSCSSQLNKAFIESSDSRSCEAASVPLNGAAAHWLADEVSSGDSLFSLNIFEAGNYVNAADSSSWSPSHGVILESLLENSNAFINTFDMSEGDCVVRDVLANDMENNNVSNHESKNQSEDIGLKIINTIPVDELNGTVVKTFGASSSCGRLCELSEEIHAAVLTHSTPDYQGSLPRQDRILPFENLAFQEKPVGDFKVSSARKAGKPIPRTPAKFGESFQYQSVGDGLKGKENTPLNKMNHPLNHNIEGSVVKRSVRRPLQVVQHNKRVEQ